MQKKPVIVGLTLGNPYSASTYSGVPYYLFNELEKMKHLAGRINADIRHPFDIARGWIDIHRSARLRRPVRNAYWRFLNENIRLQTRRLKPIVANMPKHDVVLQIGVGGLPSNGDTLMAAHVEISVKSASSIEVFSKSYGFDRLKSRYLNRAIEGELSFLSQCDVIWTNSSWTAETFLHHGLSPEKFWIHAPACNADDPGPIEREPEKPPHVLFSGKDWVRKGGPLLLKAFELLRKRQPDSRLTIIGCNPQVRGPGMKVLGFLDKRNEKDSRRIDQAFRDATIFCMPSQWESVGLVYMEAALYGLPVVMLRGQRREEVFPPKMAVHLDSAEAESIYEALIHLHSHRELAISMGQTGRRHVLEHYTWPVVARRLVERLQQVKGMHRV